MSAADYYAYQQQQALNAAASVTTNAYTDMSSAATSISSAAVPLSDAANNIALAGVGLVSASASMVDAGQAVADVAQRSIVASAQAAAAVMTAYAPGQRSVVNQAMSSVATVPAASTYAPGAITATGLYTPPVASYQTGAAAQFNIPISINGPISSLEAAKEVANVMVNELRTVLKL